MIGRLSRDPKNVDCVPTLFKGGRRRVNCSIPDQKREERSKKELRCAKTKEMFWWLWKVCFI